MDAFRCYVFDTSVSEFRLIPIMQPHTLCEFVVIRDMDISSFRGRIFWSFSNTF